MIDTRDWNDPLDEIEAMVQAAGQYVGASDDLRPRVLEAARLQCGERRAQRCIGRMAIFVMLLGFFTAMAGQDLDAEKARPTKLLVAAGFDNLFSPTAVATTRGGDGDWRMIDAFTELRRQQAQVLRFAL